MNIFSATFSPKFSPLPMSQYSTKPASTQLHQNWLHWSIVPFLTDKACRTEVLYISAIFGLTFSFLAGMVWCCLLFHSWKK